MRSAENDQRGREALWLPATAFLLLISAGLLVFTSPPGDISPRAWERKTKRSARLSTPEEPRDPVVVLEEDEPQREPWWLLGFTCVVVIGIGLLFIFYTDIPVSALV